MGEFAGLLALRIVREMAGAAVLPLRVYGHAARPSA